MPYLFYMSLQNIQPNQFKNAFIFAHDSKVQSRMYRKVQGQDLAGAGFIVPAVKKGKEMKPSVLLSTFHAAQHAGISAQ